MKGKIFLLCLFFLETICFGQHKLFHPSVLSSPQEHSTVFDSIFKIVEVREFNKNKQQSSVLLKNGYAEAEIINKQDWSQIAHKAKVTKVKLIFSKYPFKKEVWLTNYYKLLGARLNKLFEIDSNLNSNLIEWSIILQTDCKTEKRAKLLFHGIEIVYEIFQTKVTPVIPATPDKPAAPPIAIQADAALFVTSEVTSDTIDILKSAEKKVIHFIQSNNGSKDSTILKVFDRHAEWKNTLIVIDWTGSMYQYGGEVLLRHIRDFKSSGIKYFVFFNDGNRKKKKIIGKTGGIYSDTADDPEGLSFLLNKIKYNGNGGEKEENNLEAILAGIKKFPAFTEIVLVADNNSCMRDYCLIEKIKTPVKVIVCRVKKTINPQYINLAYHTGGSLITMDQEVNNLDSLKAENQFVLNKAIYRYNKNKDRFEYKNKLKYRFHQNCRRFYKKKCGCE